MVAPTRLTWICHAATKAVRQAAFPADESIEDKGRTDAAEMAGRLDAAGGISLAGPERRILQTAEALGISPSIETELRDCDYGRWSGQSLRQLEATEPRALALWLSDLRAAPHGGESLSQVLRRVSDWLEGPARRTGRVVAISHPSVIRAAVIHAVGAPAASFWRVDVAPLSRTQMSHDGKSWKLQAIG